MLFGHVLSLDSESIQYRRHRWPISFYRFMADSRLQLPIIETLPKKITVLFTDSLASEPVSIRFFGISVKVRAIRSGVAEQLDQVFAESGIKIGSIYVGSGWFPICWFRQSVSISIPIIWASILLMSLGIHFQGQSLLGQFQETGSWISSQSLQGERNNDRPVEDAPLTELGGWLANLPETVAQIDVTNHDAILSGVMAVDDREKMEAKLHQLPADWLVTGVQTAARGETQLEYSVGIQTTH